MEMVKNYWLVMQYCCCEGCCVHGRGGESAL
jgi:hypothetical protein